MSYFSRKKEEESSRRRVPSFRELQRKGAASKKRKDCYGVDYDYRVIECREKCPDRFSCVNLCKAAEEQSNKVTKARKEERVSSREANDADEFDYDEVDPPEGTTLGQAYARNAGLGAAEKATDELLFMIRSTPRWRYDFSRRRKEPKE